MITLTTVPNRFSEEGRSTVILPYEKDLTVQQYMAKVGTPTSEAYPVVNGKRVELDYRLEDGEELLVLYEVHGPLGVLAAAGFKALGAWMAAHFIQAVIAIALIGYSIFQATQKPKMPSYGNVSTGDFDDSSPTYGWEGVETRSGDVNVPIPVVFGEHISGGSLINQYVFQDGDKQYLHMLLAVAEGEVDDISDIRLNDNPIENFPYVEIVKRYGTGDQTPIPNFQELHQNYAIGVQVLKDSPYVYTTAGLQLDGFEVHLKFPLGIYTTPETGGIQSASCVYKVEYKRHSLSEWSLLGEYTVSDTTKSAVYRVARKTELARDQYDIRVTRISDNSTFYTVNDMYLDRVDELVEDDLSYPHTALLAIRALAVEQLNGSAPNVTFTVRGLKVSQPQVFNGSNEVDWDDYYWDGEADCFKLLSNGTPLTWDGETYVTKFASNPVWCVKAVMLNKRFGLGDFIDSSLITDSQWLEMAKYCDEKVPVTLADGSTSYEKRFRLDVNVDGMSAALDLLIQLCAVFRGIPFYSSGQILLHIDKPETPVQVFGMGNIIAGSFVQKYESIKERFNYVECSFLNKEQNYKQDTVEDGDWEQIAQGEPTRKKSIRLFVTRPSYALRESRYMRKIAKYVNQSISFKAGIDAINLKVGQLFYFAHDVPQYGFSGRVATTGTTGQVIMDRTVTLEYGKTYKVLVRFSDDTIEERTVFDGPGSYTTLTVLNAFSQAPQQYDVYSVGEVAKVAKPYRCFALSRENNHEVTIQGSAYNENVYDDSAVIVPANNYSSLSDGIPDVEDLTVAEELVKLADGTISIALNVFWRVPLENSSYLKQYASANVYLSDNGGASWVYAGNTRGKSFRILGNIREQQFCTVAVVSVAADGMANSVQSSPTSSITPLGKSIPPSDVTGFQCLQSRDRMFFTWTPVDDADLFAYEVRRGESWDLGEVMATEILTSHMTSFQIRTGPGQQFWIKAIDTTGNYSANPTLATVSIDTIPFTNIVLSASEAPDWAGTKVDMEVVDTDKLGIVDGEVEGTYTTPVRDAGYKANFRIVIDAVAVSASVDRAWDSDPTARFNTDPLLRFSGGELAGALAFQIRTSDDNVEWSEWSSWKDGEYNCRYWQIKMTAHRATASVPLRMTRLNYYIDLPSVDEFGSETVSVAGDGVSVIFEQTFHASPVVTFAITSGTGIMAKATAKDEVGMTVKLYDKDGTAVTGDFEYHAHGI